MRNQMIRWTAGIVLTLAFAASGCGDDKYGGETSRLPVENSPALQAEKSAPDANPASASKEDQSPPSTANKEQRPAG